MTRTGGGASPDVRPRAPDNLATQRRRVTTYVGIPSATGQPTRPTQPFILPGSINEYKAVYRICATLLRWRHLVNACRVKSLVLLIAAA